VCAKAGADVVFAPSVEELYPDGYATYVEVERLTKGLCGQSRPGHFRGVTTVCATLFGISGCDRAYFGEKDFQQLAVIRRMVRDLNMPLEIVPCPTVRLSDGLAMSSRNKYLSASEREQALVLYRSLLEAKRLVEKAGVRQSSRIAASIKKIITSAPCARVDYIAIVDAETLEPVKAITGQVVAALAVYVGTTRLIDNMRLNAKGVASNA
jgi:pantoate--beta-alanine ligase